MGVLRKTLNWYAKLSPARGKVDPPYNHVVQIGDPVLRKISEPVPLDKINTDEIQKVIAKLNYVLNRYDSVGMAAPQIGVNLKIFVMRYTEKQLSTLSKDYVKARGITIVPHTVFINPMLKVVDFQKVVYSEGCESMRGFAADVPRYKEVEVSGYNHNGEPTTQVFKDWAARIAHHEYDHINGKLYIDTMDRKTIHCTCWEEVNLSSGKVVIPLSPD